MHLASLKGLPAIIAIIVSLIVSLGGIFILGWDWRQIIILYWLTNITIGAVSLIDIARSDTTISKFSKLTAVVSPNTLKAFFAAFFTVHYGMFTLVHGIFVFAIVSGSFFGPMTQTPIEFGPLFTSWLLMSAATVIAKLSMPVQAMPIDKAFTGPYGRIVTLQVSIIFGVFIIEIFSLPAGAAILLIAVNTIFELRTLRPAAKTAPIS